jgi:hypothetical protein
MNNLTRNSFIKALIATSVVPQVSSGLSVSEKPIYDIEKEINSVDAAYLIEKYGLTPIEGEPDTYDFYIGEKRYRYGFLSFIDLWGMKFATKERHRIITCHSAKGTTLQAVRIEGKWQFPVGSIFPRDFPIHDFERKVDGKGDMNA